MTQVSVVAVFTPKAGQSTVVEETLRGMVRPTRNEPGCTRYELYQSAGSDPRFVLLEAYKDQSALEFHRTTDHYKSYRARIIDLLNGPIDVTVLADVDAGPR
jgi:quinol monooxygenase YgiN